MRARFLKMRPLEGKRVHFGTFHSVYLRILKAYGHCRLTIASESAKRNIVSSLIPEGSREDFLDLVSSFKSGKPLETLMADEAERKDFTENYRLYNEILRENGLMDYDDILLDCLNLLKGSPSVREEVRKRFSHILTDEFQDINGIQYEILKLMAPAGNNLYAVGDENQSIYGFRGSKADIFRTFTEDFPETAGYRLNINYRNHRDIFRAASKVIGDRNDTICVNESEGGRFLLSVSDSRESELKLFLSDLEKDLKANARCLVMARTNRDLAGLEALCKDLTAEYGTGIFEEGGEDKELIRMYEAMENLLYFLKNGNRGRLFKTLSLKEEKLPRSLFTEERVDLDRILAGNINPVLDAGIRRLKKNCEFMKKCSAPGFVAYYRDVWLELKRGSETFGELIKLEKEAAVLKTRENLLIFIEERAEDLRKKNEKKRDRTSENPAFLTFHASKGLEYDSVFIPDVTEGRIPKRNQIRKTDEDEERRLFYVAMTRAKERLCVYSVKTEGSQNTEPSRFLEPLL